MSPIPAFAFETDETNQERTILLEDVRRMLDIASGLIEVSAEEYELADFNGDGRVTTDDVVAALRVCADLDPFMFMGKVSQITPREKHNSSSTAKFCQVTSYCAETLSATDTSGRSNPLYSPFLKGTFDYIKSGPHTEGSGEKYYCLTSGRKIYSRDIKVFTGYKMPDNKIKVYDAVSYDSDSTDIFLSLNWRVPFNVTLKPQEYTKGYDSRAYNVENGKFTATYMDVTFYNTVDAIGTHTFDESGTVKNSKWIINKEKKTATLRIYLRETGGFYGYKAYYDDNNYLVISIKEPADTLKGKVIMLDPGHGGKDSGAVSKSGYYEKNLNYPVALKVKKYLEDAGATVVLTRGDTSNESTIQERRLKALKENPDLYVAIHADSSTSSSAKGCSVYYYKNYSAPLAFAVEKELPKAVKSGVGYDLKSKGTHFYPFHVTRVENCPAILIECGFVSNPTELEMMKKSSNQTHIAKGIYNGIAKYFNM